VGKNVEPGGKAGSDEPKLACPTLPNGVGRTVLETIHPCENKVCVELSTRKYDPGDRTKSVEVETVAGFTPPPVFGNVRVVCRSTDIVPGPMPSVSQSVKGSVPNPDICTLML